MRVVVSVVRSDGTQLDRPPTEAELQEIAERYAAALLQLSLPGSQVRVKKKKVAAVSGV